MAETRNEHLTAWMKDAGMSAAELADAVNEAIRDLTGRPGVTSERTVFRWKSGENRWPQARQRRALEAITGRTVADLGFVPRGKGTTNPVPPTAPPEDPVHRRRFVGAATSTAAAVAVPRITRPPRVGTSDVIRLRDSVENLVALDAERGGHTALERAALAGADEALGLQRRSTTQRVRQRLFAVSSDFVATAAWSLIDAGQLDAAGKHLDRALTLAGMAQDPDMTMQVWNLRAMLARQRKDYGEAIAAAQAAQATTVARRSPLHASLVCARTAIGLAHAGDHRAALRSLGRAEDALEKADLADPRAPWIAFYGPAELYSLTAIVRDVVGHPTEAEAAAYRALSALPETYRRNRAHTTARLALAQLHQGDAEQACATSADIFTIMDGDPLPGRMRQLLGDFQRDLFTLAPSAHVAHEWTDRYRNEWSIP
ncbi:XRE family transcriptional regulator [Streptomyces halobius]|uniref:XRE family transcriptional regulator n=1 Tax=Streptomyces halobius TaxID=2879846 RepID=A0ABY4MHA1_9ACTN|nr:XRE family transcriptional regulator [Streptomyces halobius]UQA95701.1 XRE family transcriptional regulator [Streptomyces halobius]